MSGTVAANVLAAYGTSKETVEWTGSAFHVPVGTPVCSAVLLIRSS
jgi:hypothetical protein